MSPVCAHFGKMDVPVVFELSSIDDASSYYTHMVISAGYNQLQLTLLFWLL
jgi:hypothetical protein